MSPSETTTTYEPVWLRHRQNCVEAIPYDGTEHCRGEIVQWVNQRSEGHAHQRYDGSLMLLTPQGWHVVKVNQWVARGVLGEWYNPDPEAVALNYDRVPGPGRGATLTRDQAAAIVVAADHIGDECRDLIDLQTREYVQSLVEYVHQLATALEADR